MAVLRRHDDAGERSDTPEQHRLGYMAVYPIEDGQATGEPLYVGPSDQCDTYVSVLLEGHPEMKGNIIITNI